MPSILGKEINPIGYGLMGFTWRSNPVPEEQAFAAMKTALNNGSNFWNAGEFYGTPEYNSLHLLERYFTKYPEDADKVVLSIKGCLNVEKMAPDGTPEGVRRSVDNCLKLLKGKKKIDIFESARVDQNVPLEVTLRELEKYVTAGKIGGIALSECGAKTITAASAITKIVAVEVEVSLWATDIWTNGIADACAQNNIPVVAYSPLGRGILTGQIKTLKDIPEGDIRLHLPRFQPDTFDVNIKLVHKLESIASEKGITPAQLAISWLLAQSKKDGGPEIIPIPGAVAVKRVEENVKTVSLSPAELEDISTILKETEIVGGRYGGYLATMMNG